MTPAPEAWAILTATEDAALIRFHPEFAITATGDVYRLTGLCRADTYPLKMAPLQWSWTPAVMLNGERLTIASLMREHFPDQPLQSKEA